MKNNLTAIILAAGGGQRMRPLKAGKTKVMLPILGKPVLEYLLQNVVDAGFSDVIIVVLDKTAIQITKYFGHDWKGLNIKYVEIKETLGPAYAINELKDQIKTQYFLVQYGDSIADENIAKKLLAIFDKNPKTDGVLALREVDDPTRAGVVKYKNGRISEVVEKPAHALSNHAVMGTFILKTNLFFKSVQGEEFIYRKEIFPAEYMLRNGASIESYLFRGKRVDVGKPEDVFTASHLLAKRQVKCIAFDADNTLYNTHEVAKIADRKAIKILADKLNRETDDLYETWEVLVGDIKQATNPSKRTRKYSYNLLLKKYDQDSKLTEAMNSTFRTNILKNLKPAAQIAKILPHLTQEKIIITEDSENLTSQKLHATGLSRFFKKIITSQEVGTMKPSPKFYKSLLAKFKPEEILVVGDDWQKDLEIPAELGMQVLFVQKAEDLNKLSQIQSSTPGVQPRKTIHIMGIGGAGAAAVAGIATEYRYKVSGCDINPQSPYVKDLGIKIKKGHSPSHVDGIDMLVTSPAIEKLDPKNPEVLKAKQSKIPVLTWQEFQGKYLQKGKYVIAVAGAYGKSTTTAMISQILIDADKNPTCEIGAKVLVWKSNFKVGKSKYYICEADEYNDNFLNYSPDIAVVLNTGWDHPDFFKTKESVIKSFREFIENIKSGGRLIISDEGLKDLKISRKDISVVKIKNYGKTNLSIIGDFRKQNSDAALTVSQTLGIDIEKAKRTLQKFKGVGRRLEYKGKIEDVKFYDDYAVQPYTILKTVNALKDKFKNQKVTLILEPHTFTRINTFFDQFVDALKNSHADRILITEVFAAREKGNRRELAEKITKSVGKNAKFTGSIKKSADYIRKNLTENEIILTMGAGDIYKLYDLVKRQS